MVEALVRDITCLETFMDFNWVPSDIRMHSNEHFGFVDVTIGSLAKADYKNLIDKLLYRPGKSTSGQVNRLLARLIDF
uniref:Uncharacterized protein n=1 Tax=Parascaris univalens TaxID=6257 RepID=A0A915A764_PARUN